MIQLNLSERAGDDLLIAAELLEENGYFNNKQDVIDFFEKPWKWAKELEELKEAGEDIEVKL